MKRAGPKGFTIVEMLITLIISVVFLFAILAIFNIGQSSYSKMKNESQVEADAYFAFELMKNSLRRTYGTVAVENWTNPPWIYPVLVVGNSAFGLYQGSSGQPIRFVYLKDKTQTNNQDILLSDLSSDTILTFTPNGNMITAQLSGKKGKNSFSVSMSAVKRNN